MGLVDKLLNLLRRKVVGNGGVFPLLKREQLIHMCLENAESLLKDAELILDKNKSAGHAFALGVLAYEEIAKAFVLIAVEQGKMEHQEIEPLIMRGREAHKNKLRIQWLLDIVRHVGEDDELLEALVNIDDEWGRTATLRNYIQDNWSELDAMWKAIKRFDRLKQSGMYIGTEKIIFTASDLSALFLRVRSSLEFVKGFLQPGTEVLGEVIFLWREILTEKSDGHCLRT